MEKVGKFGNRSRLVPGNAKSLLSAEFNIDSLFLSLLMLLLIWMIMNGLVLEHLMKEQR